jgi:NADH dehydrogenase (ubiquinone) 1 alpha subcomplex subunit 5
VSADSGYAFLEIEPFPRAKIMKACYHIMEQLSIGFPESCIFRIYNEERTKYIMKVVD